MVIAGFPGLKPRAIVWPSLRDLGDSPLKKGRKYSRNLRDTTLVLFSCFRFVRSCGMFGGGSMPGSGMMLSFCVIQFFMHYRIRFCMLLYVFLVHFFR